MLFYSAFVKYDMSWHSRPSLPRRRHPP